jgi:hypothetical protein
MARNIAQRDARVQSSLYRDIHSDITIPARRGKVVRARMHLWGIAAVLGFELSTGRAGATTSVGVPLQLNIASNDVAAPAGADSALLADPDGGSGDAGSDFFSDWFARVKQAQDTQPHWMTPLVTVTPRLEQEVRYDQYWEYRGNGSQFDISDSGKGLELIPTTTNEVLFNLPAYEEKLNVAHPAAGWLDDQFLVLKQRLLSADEQSGNYIVSAFLGVTASSGSPGFRMIPGSLRLLSLPARGGVISTSRRQWGSPFPSGTKPRLELRSRRTSRSSTICATISGPSSRSTTRGGPTAPSVGGRIRCCSRPDLFSGAS